MNATLRHVEHLRMVIPQAKRELDARGDFWMGTFSCGGISVRGIWRSKWIADLEDALAMEEAKLGAE